MLDTNADSARQISAVSVVAHLFTVTQNVERILALDQLLHQIRNHVRHGQANVAAHDVAVRQGALLPDANTIEGSDDSVRELVLLEGPLNKILDGWLSTKAVG